jgi:hypothetical protein
MLKALRSHKFYVPLITIVGSLGLFFIYYFFYVASQRSYADERAFRLLAAVSGQLGQKFENLRNILAASLVSVVKPEQYLAQPVFKDNFSNVTSYPNSDGTHFTPSEQELIRKKGVLRLQLLDRPDQFALLAEYRVGEFEPDPKVSCHDLRRTTPFACADINLETDLRDRFREVTGEYFDDILIAKPSGDVLFEENLSGLRIANLNALLSAQSPEIRLPALDESGKPKPPTSGTPANPPNEFQRASQFSNVRIVTIGGAEYRLYIQPLPVAIVDADGQDVRPIIKPIVKPIICGLWRSDRLQSEVVSIPYPVLIWGSLLVLSAFALLWPLLKVHYMSASERLRRKHVFYLLFSTLFVTSLLTVMVLNGAYELRDSEESGEQTKALAARIDQNIRAELKHALKFMDALGDEGFLSTELQNVLTDEYWKPKTNFLQSDFVKNDTDPESYYPYFDNVFWVDKHGQQEFKLTVRPTATPQTKVGDEPYFKDVLAKRHLTNVEGFDGDFRFDSVYSPNTGEYFVVLARPYTAPKEWGLPAPVQKLRAQVLVGKFLSLVDPVVPPGYGFAVVDHEGMVQFHSVSSRNKIEDFFKECRQDVALKALVLNAGTDQLHVNYMGKRHKMFVMPLPYLGVPAPALVVFRDTNYYSTINVACLLVFTLLAGMFCAPLIILLAICVFRPPDYPLAGLWPNSDRVTAYVNVITANVCLTLAFAIRFPSMGMDEMLISVLLLLVVTIVGCLKTKWSALNQVGVLAAILWIAWLSPALLGGVLNQAGVLAVILWIAWLSPALLGAVLYIVLSSTGISKRLTNFARESVNLKDVYLGMVLSLLLVLVVVPVFGLFKISYNTVNRLALQSAQLARWDQLIHRADRIKASIPPFEERLNNDWDRYDNAVYYPKDPSEVYPPGKEPLPESPLKKLMPALDPDVSSLERAIALASGFFPSNRFGAELRETSMGGAQTSDNIAWKSAQDGDDELLWLHKKPGNVDQENVVPEQRYVLPNRELVLAPPEQLLGVYPLWQPQWGKVVLFAVPLAFLLAFWLRYAIRRVFLTDLESVPQLKTWTPRDDDRRNLMIIGHPKSGKAVSAAELKDADTLDVAKMATTGSWTLPSLRRRITVVNHFEFDMDNPDTCMRKLAVLEKLLYVEKKTVVLLSAVDPMFYLETSGPEIATTSGPDHAPAAQVLDRWAAVLSLFEKQQIQDITEERFTRIVGGKDLECSQELRDMVHIECDHTAQLRRIGLAMLDAHCHEKPMSKGQFLEEVLDRADSYYRVLWSTCSRDERLVLFQLGTDGWANPKNERAIQQLQRRHIIRKVSGFHIMNESFTRFVRSAQSPEEVLKWEEEEQHSIWSTVRLGLSTALLMFGAWLLYAQQDVFQLGIGYVAALGTASGAVINLMRNITGSRGGAGSGQTVK